VGQGWSRAREYHAEKENQPDEKKDYEAAGDLIAGEAHL